MLRIISIASVRKLHSPLRQKPQPAVYLMLRILFLCSGNSCRSQMAEGWARTLWPRSIEPHSAGIEAHGLDPIAVRVMAESDVDISGQRSKPIRELRELDFDAVVTLSDRVRRLCPAFWTRARAIHVGLPSPPRLAADASTEEERLGPYRQARDAIRFLVESLPDYFDEHSLPESTSLAGTLVQRRLGQIQ
jgi:arsenate reductase (thioredoxin)